MEPRFNEVRRDWANWFVIARVRYIENLDITNLWKNNQNVRYIEVQLIIVFLTVSRCTTQHLQISTITVNNICALMPI